MNKALPSTWRQRLAKGFAWLVGKAPFLVIGATFLWAAGTIFLRKVEEAAPGEIVIRLAHYQLEPGVRQAFEVMGEEYRKLHPHVRIRQEAIPESTYAQWITTQIIAGTPPDIFQAGLIPPGLLSQYYVRYVLPLTGRVSQPNPYNVGTDLEGVPLAATFKDGMRLGFVEEAQEYLRILPSMLGVRLLYNRDLLRGLTGLEEPPGDLASFLEVCEKIRSRKLPDGVSYTPIAGSKYHANLWDIYFSRPYSYAALPKVDLNRDGRVGRDELYVAVHANKISLDDPAYLASQKLFGVLTPNFQTGFVGLQRDDAVILFANQRAVFMLAGLWEAPGVIKQAEGVFDLAYMALPDPTAKNPEFGPFVLGPRYEESNNALPLVVTRSSPHAEVAVDFLLFLCGQKQNEQFNRIIGWLPAIKGAEPPPALAQFQPSVQGIYPAFEPQMGGETTIRWQQDLALFEIGQITAEELLKNFSEYYTSESGRRDFDEFIRTWRRRQRSDEQIVIARRTEAIRRGENPDASPPGGWRNLVWARHLRPQLNFERSERMVREGPDGPLLRRGPYERSERSKASLRQARQKP